MRLQARYCLTLFIGPAAINCSPVLAQTPSPVPEWHYSQGHLLERRTQDNVPEWERTFGLALVTQPKYEGDNAYAVSVGPSFDIRYYDIAFASAGEGFGVNLLSTKDYRAGVALTFDLGRYHSQDHNLYGTGNISFSPETKFFAEYMLFPVTFRIDARHSFGGQGGWIGDFSVYSPLAGKDHAYFLFAGPSLTVADATNLQHIFGINENQSTNSAYPTHYLGGGARSISFAVSGGLFFTENFLFEGTVAAERLLGGAGSSPIVQERDQLALMASVEYRY